MYVYDSRIWCSDVYGDAVLCIVCRCRWLLYTQRLIRLLQLSLKSVDIHDEPAYAYRGILLDTARHYMSMQTIYHTLVGGATALSRLLLRQLA